MNRPADRTRRSNPARTDSNARSRGKARSGTRADSRSSSTRTSRSSGAPITGKRKSIKGAAQRQTERRGAANRNSGKAKGGRRRILPRVLLVILLFAVIGVAGASAVISQTENAKYAACEQYRNVVRQACRDSALDISWTDTLLAAMFVESGGDKYVKSVLGVSGDVMQAAEGAYGWIVTQGYPDRGIEPESTEASIYAGVMEFKQNLELWESYLGTITPDDPNEIQLVIQGYNFGADGWFQWCRNREVRAYTVELAQEYSETKMPADAKGTPTHAQKWLSAYETIRSRR